MLAKRLLIFHFGKFPMLRGDKKTIMWIQGGLRSQWIQQCLKGRFLLSYNYKWEHSLKFRIVDDDGSSKNLYWSDYLCQWTYQLPGFPPLFSCLVFSVKPLWHMMLGTTLIMYTASYIAHKGKSVVNFFLDQLFATSDHDLKNCFTF